MLRFALVIVLLCVATAGRSQAAEAGTPTTVCATCHGQAGEGNQALGAPRLAGQDASYLERQIRNFMQAGKACLPPGRQGGCHDARGRQRPLRS